MNDHSVLTWLAIDPHTASNVCLILLHSLWITATISVVAWCINRSVTRKSVESRYAVCTAAMILSLLTTAWMGWSVTSDRAAQLSRAVAVNATNLSALSFAPNGESIKANSAAADLTEATAKALVQIPSGGLFNALSIHSWSKIAPWVVTIYFAGLMIMVIRLSRAIWRAKRLPRRARPIEAGPIRQILERVAAEWSLSAKVLLKQTEEVAVPKIVGLLRPTILIPTAAITGLTPAELEMLLVHEVAHVRRNDIWINLLQRIAETILFFNPFIWLLSRQISALREYCCDDMTCRSASLQSNVAEQIRSRYAMALLKVAEMAHLDRSRQSQLASLAASGRSPSELRRRISRLVGEPIRDAISISRGGILLAATLALAVICVPRITQSATLAEFERLGMPISTVAGPDGNAFLQNVANSTGGKYYKVNNVKALPKIMERESTRNGSLIVDSQLLNELAEKTKTSANDKEEQDKAVLYEVIIDVEGTVVDMPNGLDRGSIVERGDTLLTLQNADLEIQLKENEAALLASLESSHITAGKLNNKSLPGDERNRLRQTFRHLENQITGLKESQSRLDKQRESLVIKSPVRGKILNYQLQRTLMNRPLQHGDNVMTLEILNDKPQDRSVQTRNAEPNISEILERVCGSTGKVDQAYLATLNLQLPKNARAKSYQITNKDRFLRKLALDVDNTAGEAGFFNDLMESLRFDPNGPEIDGKTVLLKQLGRQLTQVTFDENEIWIWQLEKDQQSATLATLMKFMASDPHAREISPANHLWLLTENDEPGAKTTAISVSNGHVWISSDLELLKQVVPTFEE